MVPSSTAATQVSATRAAEAKLEDGKLHVTLPGAAPGDDMEHHTFDLTSRPTPSLATDPKPLTCPRCHSPIQRGSPGLICSGCALKWSNLRKFRDGEPPDLAQPPATAPATAPTTATESTSQIRSRITERLTTATLQQLIQVETALNNIFSDEAN